MPLEEYTTYPVDPILDFERPDLRARVNARSSVLSLIPGRVGEALNATTAAFDIIRAIHGDPLTVPAELKGPGHEEEIAEQLARRFSPYDDLVKSRIYTKTRNDELKKGGEWSLAATAAGALELYFGIPGIIAGILEGIPEGVLLDRSFVHIVEGAIAQDRRLDERKRIGVKWAKLFEEQLEEAVKQAGLEKDPEAAQKLKQRARILIAERYKAFDERFPKIHKHRGKKKLRSALKDSLEFHEIQVKWDEYMHYLASGGDTDLRRGRIRDELIAKKRQIISYHPELKRYTSIAEIEAEKQV